MRAAERPPSPSIISHLSSLTRNRLASTDQQILCWKLKIWKSFWMLGKSSFPQREVQPVIMWEVNQTPSRLTIVQHWTTLADNAYSICFVCLTPFPIIIWLRLGKNYTNVLTEFRWWRKMPKQDHPTFFPNCYATRRTVATLCNRACATVVAPS